MCNYYKNDENAKMYFLRLQQRINFMFKPSSLFLIRSMKNKFVYKI